MSSEFLILWTFGVYMIHRLRDLRHDDKRKCCSVL